MTQCRDFSRIQEGPEMTDVRASSTTLEVYGRPLQGTEGTVTIFHGYHRIFDLQRAFTFIVSFYS